MRFPSLLFVAVVVVLAVAACGGSGAVLTSAPSAAPGGASASPAPTTASADTSASPAPSTGLVSPPASVGAVDPCALFTVADIKTATGKDYGAGVPDAYGQCTWRVGGASANNGDGQIVATVQDNQLASITSAFPGGTDVTVSGHAGYWNPAQNLQSMWVDLTGSVLVLSFDPVGPETQAAAQKLAEIALTHM